MTLIQSRIRMTLLPCFGILFLHLPLQGQWNFLTGYFGSFMDPKEYNNVLQEHNEANPDYTDQLKEIGYIQGLEFGFRYQVDDIGFVFSYQFAPKQLSARSLDFENKLQHTWHGFRGELQRNFGPVVLSGSLDYNLLRIKQRFANPAILEKHQGSNLSSRISLGYVNDSSPGFGWSIRPFYQVAWSDPTFDDLRGTLGLEPVNKGVRFAYSHFGISLTLYNGPQSN